MARLTLLLTSLLTPMLAATAQEPVTILLRERAEVGRRLVVLEDVAELSGGSEEARNRLARIDLDELPPDGRTRHCSRGQVQFRLQLAGIAADSFSLIGAEQVVIIPKRRPLSADRVAAAARTAVEQHSPVASTLVLTLAQPIVATLPTVAEDDDIEIIAEPNRGADRPGRIQVNVAIRINGVRRLSLPVYLEAKPAGPLDVQVGDPVRMTVRLGSLEVVASGEALQAGARGETIRVRNVDSKKVVAGRVIGPRSVEIDATAP